ncbi:hypothetical protein PDIG_38200 [Penicillium digitatum PHI26]|uniref:Uncharacterized protein n=2 Tax=Penicillium digitatum TaxID=36651 RepID=K9GFA9_PEND2|nr:hypothetical protein PDIP_84780 [Penicillium digitatum Pd1]EKV05116.1 hypothetical protein PDIP_84780 [Penicillium digitatum Pd1]EKV13438.1 hypothetical protein PDIG_38200 [Penicillium digitatum PHI26]
MSSTTELSSSQSSISEPLLNVQYSLRLVFAYRIPVLSTNFAKTKAT